jgi:hypothetical protein
MNKFIAISLPILWMTYCFSHAHEYEWILRALLGLNMGYVFIYACKYNDLKKELMTIKENEYYQEEEMRKFTEGFAYRKKNNEN